ncbi:predicted protein [Postia placenta Mad-698-R]|nr:predicted protein [Postia placenta Mad-698-R]
MPAQPKMIYLPETMANWPWPRYINPHYEEVKAESDAWFKGFKPFTKQSQIAFDKGDLGRLASLAYPWGSKEHLRTGCALMNVFFVIDEYTDVESASIVRDMVDMVTDAINNTHKARPEGECRLGEITRQFWERAIKTATPSSQKHFIEAFTDWLNSVVGQATDRDNNHIRTIDSYLKIRRENAGARPAYFPAELGLNLPDDAFYHPVVTELKQATGDGKYNILTVVMHQFNIDLEAAMAWVASYHKGVENKFLDGMRKLPSFGPAVDRELQEYVLALAIFPRANDCWSFESGRYFGTKGLQVQKTRYVPLLPKGQPRAEKESATGASGCSLLALNDDVLLAIVSFLSQEDALKLSCTARGIRSIAMRQVNPKLRKLSMSMSQGDLDPMDVFEGLTHLSNLQILAISDASPRGEGRRPESQRSRIPVVPSIKRLDLIYCRDVSGLRLSPVRLSFTIGTCTPSFWETLLGNLPRLRALEVRLIDLRLEDLGEVTLIQWTMFQENMLRFLRPARIACLKIQTNTITCSVNKTSLRIAMEPERLHSLPRLVAESIPSMELFAVGLYLQPNPYLTYWTRIRVNGDNQRVVEAIDSTVELLFYSILAIVRYVRIPFNADIVHSEAYNVGRFHVALNRPGRVLRHGEAPNATAT